MIRLQSELVDLTEVGLTPHTLWLTPHTLQRDSHHLIRLQRDSHHLITLQRDSHYLSVLVFTWYFVLHAAMPHIP